jgi:amino acid transporter
LHFALGAWPPFRHLSKLIQVQLPFAIAKDKLFPSVFMKLNAKGVPVLGVVISSIFVSVLMSMNYTKALVEQFKFFGDIFPAIA